jgi:16S rRNA (guanine(966)-N(2))-methyltransferase RsmD
MRISAGTLRGRQLQSPKGLHTRPTSDLLRQAIFNVVGLRVIGARVLDLYAGTGAIGLEALSRGAAHATFVEQDPAALRSLRENVRALGVADRASVVAGDVRLVLRRGAGDAFACAFLDPPYGLALAGPTVEALASGDVLSDNAVLVVQAFHKEPLPAAAGPLRQTWRRRYGESTITLYERE